MANKILGIINKFAPTKAVSPDVANIYGKAKGEGFNSGNNQVREFISNAARSGKTNSPAFKKTIEALGSQKGAAAINALGMGAVLGAGVIGAYVIRKKGQQLNKEVKAYGEDTIKRQDELLKAAKLQGYKKRLKTGKKLKPDEQEEYDFIRRYSNISVSK